MSVALASLMGILLLLRNQVAPLFVGGCAIRSRDLVNGPYM